MKTNRLLKYLCATVSPILLASGDPAQAATVYFNFDTLFSSGAVAPVGPSPWLTLTTTDTGTNQVKFDFTASSTIANAYVMDLLVNLNPSLDLSKLAFGAPTIGGLFTTPTITMDVAQSHDNSFKADGDGYYDIKLAFAQSNSDGANQRFTTGETLSYNVTYSGTDAFNAESFNAESYSKQNPPANGPFIAAAHMGTTGNDGLGSAWVAPDTGSVVITPEPSAGLYGVLALALSLRRRRPTA